MKTVNEEMVVSANETDPMYDDSFTVYPPLLDYNELESVIVFERLWLYNRLRPCGAKALLKYLQYLGVSQLPSVSTVNRILSKHGLTNKRTGYYSEDFR